MVKEDKNIRGCIRRVKVPLEELFQDDARAKLIKVLAADRRGEVALAPSELAARTGVPLELVRIHATFLVEVDLLQVEGAGETLTYRLRIENLLIRALSNLLEIWAVEEQDRQNPLLKKLMGPEAPENARYHPPIEEVLGAKERLMILRCLMVQESSWRGMVSFPEIVKKTGMEEQVTRTHLKALVEGHIVREKSFGPVLMYRIPLENMAVRVITNLLELWDHYELTAEAELCAHLKPVADALRQPEIELSRYPETVAGAPAELGDVRVFCKTCRQYFHLKRHGVSAPLHIIKDELKRTTLFRDETKLSVDYVPPGLPHRDECIRRLAHLCKSLIDAPGGASLCVLITGASGTGKTAIVKRFGTMLQEVAEENNINLLYVHVDCRRERTGFAILNRLTQSFGLQFPKESLDTAELLRVLSKDILEKENGYLLLCLDAVDTLDPTSETFTIISQLLRLQDPDLNAKPRVSLLAIANDTAFREKLAPDIGRLFRCTTIPLERYSSSELQDILSARVKEAFFDGTVLQETIRLIADFAAELGDVRFALDLLWGATKCADAANSPQVLPEHAREAKVSLNPGIKKEVIQALTLHQKLVLLAIARHLKNTQKAYITMGEFQKSYSIICEEYGIKPHGYTKMWEHIKEITAISELLSAKVVKIEGKPGQKTVLRLNVPITLVEVILDDEFHFLPSFW